MFTGIIENLGIITQLTHEGTNLHISIASAISKDLKIDQSLAHNGVCLTVVSQDAESHTVTAIDETLKRTNLSAWQVGDLINLERAMMANARLDGHIVQGHVDTTAVCVGREDREGSWVFSFRYTPTPQYILVDKGSVCINGVSLTVVEPLNDVFSVAIIPYTFEHTNFQNIKIGDAVNLEFDVIGKYILKYFDAYKSILK